MLAKSNSILWRLVLPMIQSTQFWNPTSARRNCRPGLKSSLSSFAGSAIVVALVLVLVGSQPVVASELDPQPFVEQVQPILEQYCGSCHADGMKKGGVAFDGIEADPRRLGDRKLWSDVLKNVRGGIMPPAGKPRPGSKEQQILEDWIKYTAFGINSKELDPGRVTVRRLNRNEYRNTIRDLIGVDYDSTAEFPPDDSGHGFDNIGDVLTMSPLLLEKYIAAANAIVSKSVPTSSRAMVEKALPGRAFRSPADKGRNRGQWPRTALTVLLRSRVRLVDVRG